SGGETLRAPVRELDDRVGELGATPGRVAGALLCRRGGGGQGTGPLDENIPSVARGGIGFGGLEARGACRVERCLELRERTFHGRHLGLPLRGEADRLAAAPGSSCKVMAKRA